MDFKQFYSSLFLEKYLSYNIPKDEIDPSTGKKQFGSKEKLLYDFYVLSYLSQFNLDQNIGQKKSGIGELIDSPTMRRELNQDTKESFEDAKKTLLPYLKETLLSAVFFAVCAEFRHIFEHNGNKQLITYFSDMGEQYLNFIKKYAINYKGRSGVLKEFLTNRNKHTRERYKHDSRGYYDSFVSVKNTKINDYDFIYLAQLSFEEMQWASSYGGKPWANICKGWNRLYSAKSENDLFVAIDHIYDLQHNTDTVFNKLEVYRKNGSYAWIKNALDHKAQLKNPYELLSKCSGTIKMIALRVLKSEGFESWEGFIKETNKETNKEKTPEVNNAINIVKSTASSSTTSNTSSEPNIEKLINKLSEQLPSAKSLLQIKTSITEKDFSEQLGMFMCTDFIPYFFTKQKYTWFTDELKYKLKNAKTLRASASAAAASASYASYAAYYAASYASYAADAASYASYASAAASAAYAAYYANKIDPSMESYFIRGIKKILQKYPVTEQSQEKNISNIIKQLPAYEDFSYTYKLPEIPSNEQQFVLDTLIMVIKKILPSTLGLNTDEKNKILSEDFNPKKIYLLCHSLLGQQYNFTINNFLNNIINASIKLQANNPAGSMALIISALSNLHHNIQKYFLIKLPDLIEPETI